MAEIFKCISGFKNSEEFPYFELLKDKETVYVKVISNYRIQISKEIEFTKNIYDLLIKDSIIEENKKTTCYETPTIVEHNSLHKFEILKSGVEINLALYISGYPNNPISLIGKIIEKTDAIY